MIPIKSYWSGQRTKESEKELLTQDTSVTVRKNVSSF